MQASCHCGAVRLEVARRPRQLTTGSAPSLAAVHHRPAGNIESSAREVLAAWEA
jgi:hypothetical protein